MAVDILGLVTTAVGIGVGVVVIGGLSARVPTTVGKYLTALALSVGAIFLSEKITVPRLNQLVKGIGLGGVGLIATQLLKKTPLLFPFMTGLVVPPQELSPEEEELLGVPPQALPEEKILAEELAGVPPQYVQRPEEMPAIVL